MGSDVHDVAQTESNRGSPRLFVGNFDFEHRLAVRHAQPNQTLKRLNAELACVWLSIANPDDLIWTPLPVDDCFFRDAERAGLPRVRTVSDLAQAPRDVECVPWGWSHEIYQLADQYRWKLNAPPADAVCFANSRRTSARMEREWAVGLKDAREIVEPADLNSAIQTFVAPDRRWVVKAEFGMSARERILGSGTPTETDVNWVRRRLRQGGVLFFEPWVDRVAEFGLQFDLPRQGPPIFLGATPMLVDRRGQYAGSWFAFRESRFESERTRLIDAIDVASRAATVLQAQGYYGPLGIDAMIYRDELGQTQIRPLQDINARWTMGRLSLGWRKLLNPGDEGLWWHGTEEIRIAANVIRTDCSINSSPNLIGTTPCRHVSRILIHRGGGDDVIH